MIVLANIKCPEQTAHAHKNKVICFTHFYHTIQPTSDLRSLLKRERQIPIRSYILNSGRSME